MRSIFCSHSRHAEWDLLFVPRGATNGLCSTRKLSMLTWFFPQNWTDSALITFAPAPFPSCATSEAFSPVTSFCQPNLLLFRTSCEHLHIQHHFLPLRFNNVHRLWMGYDSAILAQVTPPHFHCADLIPHTSPSSPALSYQRCNHPGRMQPPPY